MRSPGARTISRWPRQTRHTDSMTGTSTSTPTTVARAAPEPAPYSAIAVATASSKKFERADERARCGHRVFDLEELHQAVGQRRVEVDLDQDRHRDQEHVEPAGGDVLRLEGEDQHQGRKQREHGHRVEERHEPSRRTTPCPWRRMSQVRRDEPAARGITTKIITEYSSTLNGTSRSEAPDTSSLTIGANATSMIRSLTETCTRV